MIPCINGQLFCTHIRIIIRQVKYSRNLTNTYVLTELREYISNVSRTIPKVELGQYFQKRRETNILS
jgi:hypothetical protein